MRNRRSHTHSLRRSTEEHTGTCTYTHTHKNKTEANVHTCRGSSRTSERRAARGQARSERSTAAGSASLWDLPPLIEGFFFVVSSPHWEKHKIVARRRFSECCSRLLRRDQGARMKPGPEKLCGGASPGRPAATCARTGRQEKRISGER